MSTSYEKTVSKAVNSKVEAPKRKHVRNIVIESWNEGGARSLFVELEKKAIETNEVIAFKALTVIHKVLQEGPHQNVLDCNHRIGWLKALRDQFLRQSDYNSKGYWYLASEYVLFLLDKIKFHGLHPEFEGDIALDKFLKGNKIDNLSLETCTETVSHLMDLQDAIFKMVHAVIDRRSAINDCKAACFIPLVVDSYAIYTTSTHFLNKMVERLDRIDSVQFLIERFYTQYISLRDFYLNANAVRSVSSVIAVPNLPPDPPRFQITKKEVPKPRKKIASPIPVRKESSTNLLLNLVGSPKAQNFNFSANIPPPHPYSNTLQVPQFAPQVVPPVFYNPPPVVVPQAPYLAPPSNINQNVGERNWVQFKEPPKDPFSDLLNTAKSVHASTVATPTPTPAPLPVPTPVPQTPTVALKPDDKPQQENQDKTKVITKIITKTINNTTEINKLKARIEELEHELEKLQTENKDLESRIVEREALIAELTAARQNIMLLSEEAHSERSELLQENETLRHELDSLLSTRERERFDRAVAKLDADKEAVELLLSLLDNPTNLGNQDATPQDVMESAFSMNQVVSKFVGLCSEDKLSPNYDFVDHEKDFFNAATAVSNAIKNLFQNSKGASRLINNDEIRNQLIDSCRKAGSVTAELLATARQMGGIAHDENDRRELSSGYTNLQGVVESLIEIAKKADKAIQDSKDQQTNTNENGREAEFDTSGLDLDDLAQRELLNAAKTIEDAANLLLNFRANKKPRSEAEENNPDISEAILEAARAITQATATLVSTAASAQAERTQKGRESVAAGIPYKRDPAWAEGLISAAKAVAMATSQLVYVANDAAQNKLEGKVEEALIAASKAVASSTSQLVAAARAKSDINSPNQEKLEFAAKSVNHATSLLIDAAKAASSKEEEEAEAVDYTKLSATGYKVKEMEQQMLILRLEKELQKSRNVLAIMRKAEYAHNNQ